MSDEYKWYYGTNTSDTYINLRLSKYDHISEIAFIYISSRDASIILYVWVPGINSKQGSILTVGRYPTVQDAINAGSEVFDVYPVIDE
jgi:hypothetical protein